MKSRSLLRAASFLTVPLFLALSVQAQQRGTFDRTYGVATNASATECQQQVLETMYRYDLLADASLTELPEGSSITAYVNATADQAILQLSCIQGLK